MGGQDVNREEIDYLRRPQNRKRKVEAKASEKREKSKAVHLNRCVSGFFSFVIAVLLRGGKKELHLFSLHLNSFFICTIVVSFYTEPAL